MISDTPPAPSPGRLGHPLQAQDIPWPLRLRVLGVWTLTVVVLIVELTVPLPFSGQVALVVGEVTPNDIVTPRQVTYISEALTAQRQALAASAVPEVYDPPLARIGREQMALAGQILEFINAVRSDSYADDASKAAYLSAITKLDLPARVRERIIALPAPAWERAAGEVQVVLERAMREEIRESNLADERRKVPARVRLDLSDEDAEVIGEIVSDLLAPNSFFNQARTEEHRQAAIAAVEPETRTLERNETIIRAGDIVTDLDVEALKAAGLQQTTLSARDIWAAAGFALLLAVIFIYYLWRVEPQYWFSRTSILLLAFVAVVAVGAARVLIPGRSLVPYAFPFAALTCLLTIVLNQRVSLVVTGLFVLAVGWLTSGNLELMTYAFAGALMGTLKLRRGDRLANFMWAGLYVIAINLAVVLAFRLASGRWDVRGPAGAERGCVHQRSGDRHRHAAGPLYPGRAVRVDDAAAIAGAFAPHPPAVTPTAAEGAWHLSPHVDRQQHGRTRRRSHRRGRHPDPRGVVLPRRGQDDPALFLRRKSYRQPGPPMRASTRTPARRSSVTHVKDGVELARKYRIPQRVIDFIPEHQGTLLVSYFYNQAMRQAPTPDSVDPAAFRYPGPKPQSRETALTLLADGAEATVRARHPGSVEELDQIVAESIQDRLLSGQLDECPITVADLATVRRAFVDVLRGLHHPRISYSGQAAPLQQTAPHQPPAPPSQQETPPDEQSPAEPNRTDAAAF